VLALPGVPPLILLALLARVPATAVGVTLTLHVVLDLHRGYGAAGLVGAASTIAVGQQRVLPQYVRPNRVTRRPARPVVTAHCQHLPVAGRLPARPPLTPRRRARDSGWSGDPHWIAQ
jgi:hypothetical protein